MNSSIPKKQRKLTNAAIAALWLLRRDHRTGGAPFRSARDLHEAVGYSTQSSIRYGLSVLESRKLVRFAGYDNHHKLIMTWAFNPDAEEAAKAIIEENAQMLTDHVVEYRKATGGYDRMAANRLAPQDDQ